MALLSCAESFCTCCCLTAWAKGKENTTGRNGIMMNIITLVNSHIYYVHTSPVEMPHIFFLFIFFLMLEILHAWIHFFECEMLRYVCFCFSSFFPCVLIAKDKVKDDIGKIIISNAETR